MPEKIVNSCLTRYLQIGRGLISYVDTLIININKKYNKWQFGIEAEWRNNTKIVRKRSKVRVINARGYGYIWWLARGHVTRVRRYMVTISHTMEDNLEMPRITIRTKATFMRWIKIHFFFGRRIKIRLILVECGFL